ncbi:MAG: sulfite exporter TauE/SafE family protein [Burkholderiaceae bacterium]|nr:sulfite exporter TauE/SafE family protein [Burkholderiaceae bacterium]
MSGPSLIAVFMIGLLGSVHCVGMCGGIVSAISVASAPVKRFPVAVVADGGGVLGAGALHTVLRIVSYNLGRIGSYAVAGAIAGGVARSARTLAGVSNVQMGGYWVANLMLVALGLYLMGAWQGLAYLEFAGHGVWRRIQPLTKKLLPLDNSLKMLAAGGIWGWLPCGMVYSVLLTAMLSGSALSGAAVMLAFGLGTMPTLLTMGLFGARLKTWMQRRPVRVVGGLLVLAFGLLGLFRAVHGMPMSWLDTLCVTPAEVAP